MTPTEYIENVLKTESVVRLSNETLGRQLNSRILHGAMGACTEGGELLDACKKHVFYGRELDKVNIKEEIGDVLWYIAILCDELGLTFEEVMDTNIAKLKARYGEKFSAEKAENRDLEKERAILENSLKC